MHLSAQTNAPFCTVAIHPAKVSLLFWTDHFILRSPLSVQGRQTKTPWEYEESAAPGQKREETVTQLSVKLTLVIVLLLSLFLTEQKDIKSQISISQSVRKSRAIFFSPHLQPMLQRFYWPFDDARSKWVNWHVPQWHFFYLYQHGIACMAYCANGVAPTQSIDRKQ